MPSMTLSTSQEVFAAARHLPWEAMLVIHDFAWDDYEELLEVIGDRPGLRVSYDDGRLEILSPSPKHDKFSRVPDIFVTAFCEVRGLNCEVYGSATWKSRELGKGVEADACYYVKNAYRVVGKKDIQLGSDPPPDIAVEIDISNSSLKKLAIYAA
jgi:Uma2 family endonuclease